MAIVVVGGHSRKVGKTSVVSALIRALSEYRWTAIKISSHWHDAAAESADASFSISEETNRDGNADSSRFLRAGALRSLWVRVRKDGLEPAVRQLLPAIQPGPSVIIEGNSVLRFITPDFYLIVLRNDIEDFKDSARETLSQADAALLINTGSLPRLWKGVPHEAFDRIPGFTTDDPNKIPVELIDLVRSRL
jgi:molybdopterin-guanine dinucleotide biosynthesis protein